jgi:hypothetical protein
MDATCTFFVGEAARKTFWREKNVDHAAERKVLDLPHQRDLCNQHSPLNVSADAQERETQTERETDK